MQTLNANLPEQSQTFIKRTAQSFRDLDAATRAAEHADQRTRAIRDAIKDLDNISEREVCAIVASLTAKVQACGWSHTAGAIGAMEYLTGAHEVLEQQDEVHA